jgi:hypothetical protein
MRENKRSGKNGVNADAVLTPSLEAARLRKENALAEKYELQTARERGELVPIAQVRVMINEHFTRAKNRLIGLAASVSPLLMGREPAEQQEILESRIAEVLNELAESTR